MIKRIISFIIFFLFFASILISINVFWQRFTFEAKDKNIELVLDWSDAQKLALREGVPTLSLLDKFKDAGITTIAVGEETLEDLIDLGRISVDINSDFPFGILLHGGIDLLDQIEENLILELGKGSVRRLASRTLYVIDDLYDLQKNIAFGFPVEDISRLKRFGFNIILRPYNSMRLSTERLQEKLEKLILFPDIKTVIFMNESVLGYKNNIETTAKFFRKNNFNFGFIEMTEQLGAGQLAKKLSGKTIRVHSITEEEMEKLTPEECFARLKRSVRERGIKIIYLHLFFNREFDRNLVHLNIHYVKKISQFFKKQGGLIRVSEPIPAKSFITPLYFSFIGLSITLASIMLLQYFNIYFLFAVLVFLFLSFLAFVPLILPQFFFLFQQIFALICAAVFPSLSVVFTFHQAKRSIIFLVFLQTIITFLGVLFLITVLGHSDFITGVYQFKGIKFAFILPLFIVGLYFFRELKKENSEHKITFRDLIDKNLTVGAAVLILIVFFVGLLYVLRSGNEPIIPVSVLEMKTRLFLENLFWVRPRTKEIFGYPFLIFAFYLFLNNQKKYLPFFAVAGTVVSVSIINTFAHAHSPLLVSLIRTLNGFIIGIVLGYLIILFYSFSTKKEVTKNSVK